MLRQKVLTRHRSHQAVLALPLRAFDGGLALSMDRMAYDRANFLGPSGGTDLQLAVSVGAPWGESLAVGAAGKWLRSRQTGWMLIGKPAPISSAWAVDLGLCYQPRAPLPLRLGLMLANLGAGMRYERGGSLPLPAHLRLGLAATSLHGGNQDLHLAAELRKGLVHQEVGRWSRLQIDGLDAFWTDDGWLGTEPLNRDGTPNAPAYDPHLVVEPMPRTLITSWLRKGLREELHQATYHLGAEWVRRAAVPLLGACRLALRAGRLVDPSSGHRSWTWGLGIEAWRLSADFSQENESQQVHTDYPARLQSYPRLRSISCRLQL